MGLSAIETQSILRRTSRASTLPFSFVILWHPPLKKITGPAYTAAASGVGLRKVDLARSPTEDGLHFPPTPQCDSQNHKDAFQLWDSKAGGQSGATRPNQECEKLNQNNA